MSPTPRPTVVHLTSVHYFDDSRIFHKEACSAQQSGFTTYVVGPKRNPEVLQASGVIGLEIPRPKNRFARLIFSQMRLLKISLKISGSIYHFHDLELLPLGIVLKIFGRRVIYDAHEDTPKQILVKHYLPKPIRFLLSSLTRLMERVAVLFFDQVVVATPAIAQKFNSDKVTIVQNFPKLDEFDEPPMRIPATGELIVGYLGVIASVRGIVEMNKAMSFVKSSGTKLLVAGNFSCPSLEEQLKKERPKNVEYVGWLNRSQIQGFMERIHLGLVVLHPISNYLESYPVKLFEYMAAGLPIIASNFPLWQEIIENNGKPCGICIDPLKVDQLSNAIDWIAEHPLEARQMGENGRNAVLKKYNWRGEERKLVGLYEKLLDRSRLTT